MDVATGLDHGERVLQGLPRQAFVQHRGAALAPQRRGDAEEALWRRVGLRPVLKQVCLPPHDQLLNSSDQLRGHARDGPPAERAALGAAPRAGPQARLRPVGLLLQDGELLQRRRPMLQDLVHLALHQDQRGAEVAAVPAVVRGAEDREAAVAVVPLVTAAAVGHLVAPHDQPQLVGLQEALCDVRAESDDCIPPLVAADALPSVRVGPNAIEEQHVQAQAGALGDRPPKAQAPELRQAEVLAPQPAVDDEDPTVD
mmetsp:Transcript_43642/g.132089  ORF Transcript_43642/g.132089 Transcript_43642/m.132089 type:complete len:256 (+) Transcript_43642:1130-1897(+)